MLCPLCNEKLRIDDVDFKFHGCKDVYAICDHCHNDFLICIRYGKIHRYTYHKLVYNEEFKEWLEDENSKDEFVFIGKRE